MTFEAAPAMPPAGGKNFDTVFGYVLGGAPFFLICFPRVDAFFVPALALLSLIFFWRQTRHFPHFPLPIWIMPLGLSALMLLSALWSVAPGETLDESLHIFPVLFGGAVLLSFVVHGAPAMRQSFVRAFLLSVMAGGLVCLIHLYSDGAIYSLFSDNAFSLSKLNRGIISLTLFSLLALPALYQDRALWRRAGFLLLILLIVLYKTDSQAAQLGFVFGAALYFFFPCTKQWAWRGLGIAIVLILFAAPFASLWMYQNLTGIVGESHWLQSGYGAHRMEIWDFISRRILENPWTGFGAHTTRIMHFDHAHLFHQADTVLHPHNFILQLWIEFGITGIALTAAFFLYLLKYLRGREAGAVKLALPAFGSAFLIGMLTYGLWQGWWVGLLSLLAIYGTLLMRDDSTAAALK